MPTSVRGFQCRLTYVQRSLLVIALLYLPVLYASTFTSEVLKSLSYFEPSITMFDWHETNIDSSVNDGFAQIYEFNVQEKGSVVVVRQGFEFEAGDSSSADIQVWLMAGREIESSDYDGYLSLSLLVCDFETVFLMNGLPKGGDTAHHCEPTDEVPDMDDRGPQSEITSSQIRLRLRGEETFSQTYVFSTETRFTRLSQSDVYSLLDYIVSHEHLAVTASFELNTANSDPIEGELVVSSQFDLEWLIPTDDGADADDPSSFVLVPFAPIFISDDWEGPSIEDVLLRLQDTYNVLMPAFKRSRLNERVYIERVNTNPSIRPIFVDGRKAHLIRLATQMQFYQQYTYQFAHELGQLLTNYDQSDARTFRWMEETLAELASAYTLTRFAMSPPRADFDKENWQAYFDETYLSQYDGLLLSEYGISKTDKVSSWFLEHQENMQANSVLRSLNWGVARELLPFFLDDDSAWEAAGYLSLWNVAQNETIYDYFRSWRKVLRVNRVPDRLIDHLESVFPPEELLTESTTRRGELVRLIPDLAPPEPDPVGLLGSPSVEQQN